MNRDKLLFMDTFAIFGDPIEHSLSPIMHNAAFRALAIDACYSAYRVQRERLRDAILGADAMGFRGLNLTIPLKEKALEFVRADELAAAIGAINTISFGSEICGYNTDGIGAIMALQEANAEVSGRRVLLIGAGGAARAIGYSLAQIEAEIFVINRNSKRAEDLASFIGAKGYGLGELEILVPSSEIIINATSVGMKEGDPRLFNGKLLHSGQIVFDIIYNRKTELIRDAILAGAIAVDGVKMLIYQGAEAFEIWLGAKAPVKVMEKAVRDAIRSGSGIDILE